MKKYYSWFFILVSQNPDTVANSPVSAVQISQGCIDTKKDAERLNSLKYECFYDSEMTTCIPKDGDKIKCLTKHIVSGCKRGCDVNYHKPSSTLVIEQSGFNTNNICNFKEPELGNECNFQYGVKNVLVEKSLIKDPFVDSILKSLIDNNFNLNSVKPIYTACKYGIHVTLLGTTNNDLPGFSTMLTSKTQGDDLILSQTTLSIDKENNVCQRGILFADGSKDESLKTILDQLETYVKIDTGQRWMINGKLFIDQKYINFFLNNLSILDFQLIEGQTEKTTILGQWEQEKKTYYTKQIKMKDVDNKPDFVKMSDESLLFCNYNTVVDRTKNIWGCTTQQFLFDKYDYETLEASSCQNFLNHQMNIWEISSFMGVKSIEYMICPTGLVPTVLNLETIKDKLNTFSYIIPKTWSQIFNSSESSITDPKPTSILIQESNKIFGAKNMQLDYQHRLKNLNFFDEIKTLCDTSVDFFPETQAVCPTGQQINLLNHTKVLLYDEYQQDTYVIGLEAFFVFDGTSQDCVSTYIPGVSRLSRTCNSEAPFEMRPKNLLPNNPNNMRQFGEPVPQYNSYFTDYNAPLEQQGNQRYWHSSPFYRIDSDGVKKPINQLPGGKKFDDKAENMMENIFQGIVFKNQDYVQDLSYNFTEEKDRLEKKYGKPVSVRHLSGCRSTFEGPDSSITSACNSYCRNPNTQQFGQVTVESCPAEINKIERDSLEIFFPKKNGTYSAYVNRVYNQDGDYIFSKGIFDDAFNPEILQMDLQTDSLDSYAYNIACSFFGEPNKHNTGLPHPEGFLCWNTVVDNMQILGGKSTYVPYQTNNLNMTSMIMPFIGFLIGIFLQKTNKSISINSFFIIIEKFQYMFFMLIEKLKSFFKKNQDAEQQELKKQDLEKKYVKNLQLKKNKKKSDPDKKITYYKKNKIRINLIDPAILIVILGFGISDTIISMTSMSKLFQDCLNHLSLNQCTISNQRSVFFLCNSVIDLFEAILFLFLSTVFMGREILLEILPKKVSKPVKYLSFESYNKGIIAIYLFKCVIIIVQLLSAV